MKLRGLWTSEEGHRWHHSKFPVTDTHTLTSYTHGSQHNHRGLLLMMALLFGYQYFITPSSEEIAAEAQQEAELRLATASPSRTGPGPCGTRPMEALRRYHP